MGDPTGKYNTDTQFKNLDLRDMVIVGSSQGSLMPAHVINVTGNINGNTLTCNSNLSGVSIGAGVLATGIPDNTRITNIQGNTITLNKNLSASINGGVTIIRTIGSYQNNMYLANNYLEIEKRSINVGLYTLYPAIRAQ